MLRFFRLFLITAVTLCLTSCAKEEQVNVLKDKYEPAINEAQFAGEDFVVNLNARALQAGERGEWKILKGSVLDKFVFFDDVKNPFAKFKGLPGESYTLEWKRWDKQGNATAVQAEVKIPELKIEISDNTPARFETVRFLSVDPKFRGTWSFEGAFGRLDSKYLNGIAEPVEKKPAIELHGYANTRYTAIYSYSYGGKDYQFRKVINTGNYTQDEALYELQMSRGGTRVIEDNLGNVIELDLQASGIAWVMEDINTYPAFQAFRKLRKLILGGSSIKQIPRVIGEYFLDLEELNMDNMGEHPLFPESFGNLTKLKTLVFSPRSSSNGSAQVLLPKSFANLKSLESFTLKHSGFVNFNGTLGKLTALKKLETNITRFPDDIGNLKNLQHIDVASQNAYLPEGISGCQSLINLRVRFEDYSSGEVVLSPTIGDLKKLQTIELTTNNLRRLPESIGDLNSLKTLRLTGTGLLSLPDNFGNLANLEILSFYGAFTKLPENFGNLRKLSQLFLGGNAESLPESFGNLSSLVYFNAESSALRRLPVSIGNLKNLKELVLRSSKIESLPASFGNLDALEKLDLSQTQLKTFPTAVISLRSINNIYLSNTSSGDIPDDITKMKTGVTLHLYNIPNLTLDHLKYIVSISRGKVFQTSFGYFSSPN